MPSRDPTGFQINNARHMGEVPSVSEDELLQGDSIALIISAAGRELVAFKNKTDVGAGVLGAFAKKSEGFCRRRR